MTANRFQSLLLWMTVVDSVGWNLVLSDREFQSLLLWMTVVDRRSDRAVYTHFLVSILVVVDDGRRPSQAAAERRCEMRFQSLLLWMTVVDLYAHRETERVPDVSILVVVDDGRRHDDGLEMANEWRSFNPCCCG